MRRLGSNPSITTPGSTSINPSQSSLAWLSPALLSTSKCRLLTLNPTNSSPTTLSAGSSLSTTPSRRWTRQLKSFQPRSSSRRAPSACSSSSTTSSALAWPSESWSSTTGETILYLQNILLCTCSSRCRQLWFGCASASASLSSSTSGDSTRPLSLPALPKSSPNEASVDYVHFFA